MLTEAQKLEIRRRAKEKGISDVAIDKGINEYQKSGFNVPVSAEISSASLPPTSPQRPASTPQQPPTAPSSTPPPTEDPGFIASFIKALVDPAVNYFKYVGEAGFQATRAISDDSILSVGAIDDQVQELTNQSLELIRQAKQTNNRKEKLRLLDESRKIDEKINALGNKAGKVGDLQKTKFMDEEKIETRADIVKTGAKATAGGMAYVVPGAKTVKGAMAAGAASGALFASSQDEATVESVAEGAVIGAAIGGVFSLAGKGLKWIVKGREKTVDKNLLTKIGKDLRQDATQIRVKPSVYGAKKEKLIQETLDYLGIKGGPGEKYQQLQPALKSLSDQIDDILAKSPDTEINVADLANVFKNKLKSEVRTKSLTSKAAQDEITGYLQDLLKEIDPASMTDDLATSATKMNALDQVKTISLRNLFKLKQIVNKDYGSIATKLENGSVLTDREKIIFYGRQAIDEAITKAKPEIKDLTIMQSHLYDAARPLAAARNTVPTFRVFGVTIPKHRVIEDAVGSGLIKSGERADELLTKWVDPVTGILKKGYESLPIDDKELLVNLMSRMSILAATTKDDGESGSEYQQNDGKGIEQNGQQDYSGNEIKNDQNGSPNANLPQSDPRISKVTPSPMNPFGGLSKRQVLALALSNGAKASDLEEVGQIYDMLASDTDSISSETMQIADSLRSEYFARTKENGFLEVTNAYGKVKTAPNTPAGDVSIVFAYMKMIDPGSVVREGEFATAENTAGIPAKVVNSYNKALKGKRLGDKQREDFINAAESVYSQYQSSQAPIDALYQGLAQKYGIDPTLLGIGTYAGQ
jgi:hypothetical protein